jgi:hypothetical protein
MEYVGNISEIKLHGRSPQANYTDRTIADVVGEVSVNG